MKPAFIGIGAQKCASTWVHRVLAQHPQINVPHTKEADFFSYRFDHGYQWYENLFNASDSRLKAGEVSPSYFHDAAAPERVSAYHPTIKIVLTLRDPVQRAMSNHRHEIRLGHIADNNLSFEAGLANNPMYVEQGLYAKHLRNWLKHFPLQQFFIVLMEDIEDDPGRVAKELFRFLEVEDSFQPESLTRRYNASIANRFQPLFYAKERVYQFSRNAYLGWLWSAASKVGLRGLYRHVNTAKHDERVPPITAASKRTLRQVFAADIRQLECLIDRSLASWLEEGGCDAAGAPGLRTDSATLNPSIVSP